MGMQAGQLIPGNEDVVAFFHKTITAPSRVMRRLLG